SGWTPVQIVQGFLAASASFAGNHAAAQKFLSPQALRTFQPGSWPVTVVSPQLSEQPMPFGPRSEGDASVSFTVRLRGQQIAAISDIGQYVNSPGARTYTFNLVRVGGQWRISSLQPAALLLTQASFEEVYQPRNLYFWSPNYQSLVPEPVFAPQQDTYAAAAANLVKALLRAYQDGSPWLAGATRTSFPAGSRLIGGKVNIAGSTATVNLGGAASRAGPLQLQFMAQQLATTLTSTSYGQPPIARHVKLEVNGRIRDDSAQDGGRPGLVPGPAAGGGTLFYLAQNGTVSEWSGLSGRMIRNPPGRDQIPFSQIAVSAGPTQATQRLAGTVPDGHGCGVYAGPLAATSSLAFQPLPDPDSGPCTSISWDDLDGAWAVTARGIWALPDGGRQFEPVMLPPLPGGSTLPYHVLSLQVAPDGVRVAMLVQTVPGGQAAGGTQVVMAAITRSGTQFVLGPTVAVGPTLPGPTALSWLDPDHLVVLAHSLLYSVPVNGGTPVPVGPAPTGVDSVTAAGPGRIAVAGGGQIWTSSGPDQVMQPAVKGAGAVYQG
ncbi:MAG: LpqB family beta-propeller domain-containing protein, partial [Streptosporangiaceae bacterium]